MQRNPGFPSIEEELERALVKAGAIPEHLAGDFVGVSRKRCGPPRYYKATPTSTTT